MNSTVREPISDVGAWLNTLPESSRHALVAFGELLIGTADRPVRSEDADAFTARGLGVDGVAGMLDENRELNSVQKVTAALALAELIELHGAELGPGEYRNPPGFTQTSVGNETYRHPLHLRAIFPAGTLHADVPVVISLDGRTGALNDPEITAYVRREDQAQAREVLDEIMARAEKLNPYRGRPVRASLSHGLAFTVIDLPATLTRDTVIVDDIVWREVDLGIAAVRDHHALLNAHGLGCRRGVLLAGPPGTGKSAVSAVVAGEALAAGFTVIYVEAKAGERLLTSVVEAACLLGGPVLIVLEDIDLIVRDRRHGDGGGLSELLAAMDVASDARILTLASTNDVQTLDAAAMRTGRFDSIVEVGYPDTAAAARILAALVDGIGGQVDTAAVASALPEKTSGSDLREIVRRAVLSTNGVVSTAALLNEVGSGRYRAEPPPQGQYL
ncbi:MAG: ATP-binding protein [Gordonia sp. (in: high G+C Gram-positive bacteria)]